MNLKDAEHFMLFGGRVDYQDAVYHVIAVNALTGQVKLSREYNDTDLITVPVNAVTKHVFKEDGNA